MKSEKTIKPTPGWVGVIVVLLSLGLAIGGLVMGIVLAFVVFIILAIFFTIGFVVNAPNESWVLIFFGRYVGTIKENGFYWVNPLNVKKKISLRAKNFDSEPIKVNDKVGNPIMIGLVLVWKVEDTYRAAFDVDDYQHFVVVQSDAALRKLAGLYPYDNFEIENAEITLRAGGEDVNEQLESELRERLNIAGINVIEARINYIAYASEIAGAMLRRQQATAIVAAREKIVEGAVGMVQLALNQLSEKKILELDDDKKATMVSNLMVVLCSDESARPVVNTGTLYS
ncbi:MAG TPA: SPFH domain-containing protein [Williamwhitmania sp.]|nr:SPFH domain-containing protein [Williamwhitmania sp.]